MPPPNTLVGLAEVIAEISKELDHAKHHLLEEGSKILQQEAKRVLGTYDYGWPQLALSTQAQRVAQGFTANEPLLRTGELRDSIEREVQHGAAYVGSNNEKALWHELGTSKAPPRPFLAGAAAAKHAEIGELAGEHFHALLTKKA
jgi:phage gpG-like protein